MAPSAFEKDEADREYIRDELTFLNSALNSHPVTPLSLVEVEMYQQQVQDAQNQLRTNHSNLRQHAPKGTEMRPFTEDFYRLRELSSRLYNGFHGIKASYPAPTTPATSTHQSIRLPTLELPKFSGNLEEWVSFRDIFVTAVHNSSLSKVEKMTQLKAVLTGEAARQIRSLIISDSNYDVAWKALQDRYENNREALFSVLRRLLNQQVITNCNASNIRTLIDETKQCVSHLEVLKIPTQHWDAILIFILFSKLDTSSRELWEQSLPDTNIPALAKLYEFLEQRARALAASTIPGTRQVKPNQVPARLHHVTTSTCKFGCSSQHPYFKCPLFKLQTPQQRNDTVKRLNLCLNCIGEGHISSSCPSHHSCKTCNRKHHTMLHVENGHQHQSTSQQHSNIPKVSTNHIMPVGEINAGVLATALIHVLTSDGNSTRRSFLDGGGTNTCISERAAKQMKLPLVRINIPMAGLGDAYLGKAKYVTTFTFASRYDCSKTYAVTALVVKAINNKMPSERLKRETWPHLQGLDLADPEFDKPESVDILLGTDIFWAVLDANSRKIHGADGQPFAVKSSLGWLVAGPNVASTRPITIYNTNANLDYHLQRFFEQESVPDEIKLSSEEAECEKHFSATYKRDKSGRFVVELPFKLGYKDTTLGTSRQAAVKRFINLENKFVNMKGVKDPEKIRKLTHQWSEYVKFMQEYQDLGHMRLIPPHKLHTTEPTYYIPHHSVLKESSTTTKLRVVFDASATTSTGVSLNQCLMVGPQLQDNLVDIQLRFRLHIIAFTGDIEKMYRQIRVADKHLNYQRIIWRKDPSQPLEDYWLLTVTYGETSAPYHAVKCLQQLARDEEGRFPEASKLTLRDFYVDDIPSGTQTVEQAKHTVRQLIDLCKSGGFQLRKWTSNSKELLNSIPEHLRETNSLVQLDNDPTIKTLGVFWNPEQDKFIFRLSLPADMPGRYTKRIILSDIAKIYDPLGWLAPTIIICKMFMQELWKTNCNWDDLLPDEYQLKWLSIKQSLRNLEKIEIPRCVCPHPVSRRMLLCYSDASTKGISAAIYLHCQYEDFPSTCYLLSAKTRVAPVKHVTLPRLELNGAVLLSELMASTAKALQVPLDAVHAFTDSTITLHWIKSSPLRWKIYVRRRVQAVQDNYPAAQWHHIPGDVNPADCASRGIPSDDLLHHPLWWNGSPYDFSTASPISDLEEEEIAQLESEAQGQNIHFTQPRPLHSIYYKYSSFNKLQRVMAFVIRFINNWCRSRRNTPLQKGRLTVHELRVSHNFILRQLQQSSFPTEYTSLQKGSLPNNSSLLKLHPFLASDNLIRVGGRLRNSDKKFSVKHPILIPKGHYISLCIIRDLHIQLLHAGPSLTLATLQQRYWITNGRDGVRMVIRKCVTCTRQRADVMKQMMGDLPQDRVIPAPAFSKIGIDYAGPICIRPMVRSRVTLKCWLAIFVCFTTKAIHIEVVSSMTTDCFIAALRRFISRRGKPTDIYSDCGTNFKGTDKVLRDFCKLSTEEPVQVECSKQHIQWHFNPAGAPHFGGLWEAGIKSVKYHLKRVMGSCLLTYEEIYTLVVQIEGILNSRPIVPASADPSDLEALTPAHFLIGRAITAFPEPNLTSERETHLKRWQLLQQQQQRFWRRWSNEYLTRLQQRPKWLKPSHNLEIGNLVIIKDENLPPLKWKLGRVVAVHPGADGQVRVATLRTAVGEIKRPVVKLTLLPVINE